MWKKSEILQNKKFRLLLLTEAILLLIGIVSLFSGERAVADMNTMEVALSGGEYLEDRQGYYIDGSYGYNGVFLTAKPGELRPGVYRLQIALEAGENLQADFKMESESEKFHSLLSNPAELYGGVDKRTYQFYVCETEDSAKITVNYSGGEPLLIKGMEVVYTNAGSRILICLTLAGAVLVNTLVMLHCYMKRYPVPFEKKLAWFGVPGVAILASFPLFVNYIIVGADCIFHLMRIEALAQSISQWDIPARIEAMWLYGHGYANSIFYCDTFLVLPALMRLIGFDITVAYGTYVFAVNLATAVIAWYCFKGCFQDGRIGMIGSMLYTLAPYRIYNIYNRCAVGEYTAMAFLPLLAYGFYRIFTDDVNREGYRWNFLIPALGFSGLIQSHVLTCEIAGGFTILLCLVLIKKVFRRHVFWELAKTVIGTVVFNFWYLVPFLDMMASGQYYFSRNSGNTIQKRGILPANIFYTMQAAGSNSRFHEMGLLETEPIGVGMAVLLGVGAFWLARVFLRNERDKKQDEAAIVAFFIGVSALVISTCYFPWDALQSWNRVTGMVVSMLQFPTRLTIVPVVCLTFVTCAGAAAILKCKDSFWKNTFFVILCGTALVFSLYQTNDILVKKSGMLRLYTAEGMGHSAILGGEYLPEGTELNFRYHAAVPSEGVEIVSFEKKNLNTATQLHVIPEEGEYWVEFPMLLYKGYRAQDVETGQRFEVQAGNNQVVRILLPGGYNGTLRVWYAGMWYWRAAEFISLAAVIAVGILYLRRNGQALKKRGCRNSSL